MPDNDSDPQELKRRAVAVNEILTRIGLSGGSGSITEWWNLTGHEGLGGRTPTQAWLAGDHDAVENLVFSWFDRSEQEARRAQGDEGFREMLCERRKALGHDSAPRASA